MDLNNRVVMSDGSVLPRAEGEGGAARVICERLAANTASGPTLTSASTVELVSEDVYYHDETTELAALGLMEWEVLPAEQTNKSKKSKPYDRPESKKVVEKALPEVLPRPRDPMPNRAYVELPPTILKHPTPEQPVRSMTEDEEMKDDVIASPSKGKSKENPVVIPTSSQVPERVSAPKEAPRFEVVDPKTFNEKKRSQLQYKYATELMNQTNQESVFQKLLSQPVTLKLGEVLGSSFELGWRFQTATKSQRFAIQQARVSSMEVSDFHDEDEEQGVELPDPAEFIVNSGESDPSGVYPKEIQDMGYQRMLQREYERQFAFPIREVNLARPHEYRAMVTARLNGKIGDIDYMMLIDSGSELNIMMLQQAQDLALPIDDSGNSWTLKGISGHTMGLEGICWNVTA